jgi:hypothetical protein
MKRIAIVQSNYIPWRGYFDIIGLVDEFVLYDIVQFTKRDWRNRNRIKTPAGLRWLTIPVATAGAYHQSIAETRISDPGWAATHWRTLTHAYAHAPYFEAYRDRWAALYAACAGHELLSDVNRLLIEAVAADLGLTTTITDASAYSANGERSERLLAICRAAGAATYLSGPTARAYLDVARFAAEGVAVEFMDYSSYQPYPQMHGPFEPSVSVLDLLFNTGPRAREYVGAR